MQLSGSIRVYVRVRPALACELEVSEKAAKPPTTRGQKRKHNSVNQQESLFHFPGQLAGLDERMAKKSKNGAFGADDPTKNILEVKEPYKDRGGLTDRRKKWTFGFDHIFDPSHGQEDIWEATEPLVQSAIDGFNVTVFAYGQTGSGKTFTMLGEEGNEGIISRAVGKLFDAKTEIEDLSRGGKKVELSVELLEVYNEKVRDLLVSGSGSDGKELSLKLSANEAVGSLVVPVGSQEEVHKILDKAQKRRCVKATASNAVSSRSHMIFTIHFQVASKSGTSRIGKLHVCDLAGSERLGKSNSNEQVGVSHMIYLFYFLVESHSPNIYDFFLLPTHQSSLLRETKHINTSLSVLSNVIEKLQVGDATIPYRESKLTYLLQNSLGGNSKTLAIVCCNPLQSHFHESLCSLRFAAKVNKVDLKAVANFSC
jgi:kinesin family protein C1